MSQSTQNANESGKLYDLNKIFDLSAGDNVFIKRIITVFIDDTPATIEAMFKAYNNWDYDTLKKISHRLKPIIKTLGISEISDEINDIDMGHDPANTEKKLTHISRVINAVIQGLKSDLEQMKDE